MSNGIHTRADQLNLRTAPAASALREPLPHNAVRCLACGHRCRIAPGKSGVCRIRPNLDGTLHAPRGYVAGLAVDPIEKKPLFHVSPGAPTLSFGMLGCNLHCAFCQNWITSQALRDSAASTETHAVSAAEIAHLAVHRGCRILTSTYNEPLITAEWAVEVFESARPYGIVGAFVSNGNGTPEVIDYLAPHLAMCNIDLKAFRDATYRKLGAKLSNTLDTIQRIHARGIWIEITTLVIPGENDDPRELEDIARFLAGLSQDIPWHVSAYRPQYKFTDAPATPPRTLINACEIGRSAGLRFVYAGNLPRRVANLENTICPTCGAVVIGRRGYQIAENNLVNGRCAQCDTEIPGLWNVDGAAA